MEVSLDVSSPPDGVCERAPPSSLRAHVVWTDLCVNVQGKGGKPSRSILVGATGYVEPGSILAIMGPSGSGKSTLLDALAGRLAPNTVQTGDILLNGQSKTSLSYGVAAYVTQEDVLIGTLTVFESIMYSASLRLPGNITKTEKRAIVDRTIREMGLWDSQNSYVGNFFLRGLSGGEKRRLSIALQILTRPPLLLLDEPTSGLDSAAAYFVVSTLKNLAKEGCTVVSSIHQPSSEVFALFDNLTLLSNGHTIYFGETANASEFFAASNHPCPPLRNPSDHYLQIINADFDQVKHALKNLRVDDVESTDPLLLKTRKNTEEVVKTLSAAYQKSDYSIATRSKITHILSQFQNGKAGLIGGSGSHANFIQQCVTLTQRSFVNMTRDPGYYWLRVAMYTMVGLCLGTIFWKVGFKYSSILGRTGVLFFVAAFLTFMSIGGFPSFVEDMKVFYHERLSGHYGVGAFVVGNTLASLPYLFLIALTSGTLTYFLVRLHSGFGHYAYFILMLFAALTCVESLMMAVSSVVGRNFLAGIVIGAGIQAIYMLVAGYFRLLADVPKPVWRYPISYIAFHTYAIQGLFKNDFPGLTFQNFLGMDGKPIGPDLSGEYVLEQIYGIKNNRGKWGDFGIIIAMIVAYRILFFVFIKLSENLGPRLKAMAKEYFANKPSEHPADSGNFNKNS
ncbi:ABC transporter G family member 11 isoform X3 [Physcomitrium patens]|uniref:ABC transporter domain-containing protein n=2 Tax=Physcomitrium patens TaxID=3218 RepID=A0A7I4A1H9_PHYPA|nr:ABC transporter G family member 11-like isoform X3 [Physcomitrium patens]|eukprot:XP_024387337.1 ABC transporter G family member 11-like isoform X3 [Physcomitrella patens]